ncbi:hypothetical protein L226DRAFT_575066 [Lentinus tigrinus ALCF2SS1-7]|uniref:Uncharacterized protein n=1 Tax=Lentinus tigrinus ALCF2SS1-6 TaxID=1328759 RepID=A0A5C2RVC0_9APHY|nr:hypothetical protein L227DRAFT_615545 [Lentinus tigrinus ALCF2SS1-6]RPD70164.1 hypothetical protein L226DRAFT_575066 [Lentinus tigrinus ALCF2SS1-7]
MPRPPYQAPLIVVNDLSVPVHIVLQSCGDDPTRPAPVSSLSAQHGSPVRRLKKVDNYLIDPPPTFAHMFDHIPKSQPPHHNGDTRSLTSGSAPVSPPPHPASIPRTYPVACSHTLSHWHTFFPLPGATTTHVTVGHLGVVTPMLHLGPSRHALNTSHAPPSSPHAPPPLYTSRQSHRRSVYEAYTSYPHEVMACLLALAGARYFVPPGSDTVSNGVVKLRDWPHIINYAISDALSRNAGQRPARYTYHTPTDTEEALIAFGDDHRSEMPGLVLEQEPLD